MNRRFDQALSACRSFIRRQVDENRRIWSAVISLVRRMHDEHR